MSRQLSNKWLFIIDPGPDQAFNVLFESTALVLDSSLWAWALARFTSHWKQTPLKPFFSLGTKNWKYVEINSPRWTQIPGSRIEKFGGFFSPALRELKLISVTQSQSQRRPLQLKYLSSHDLALARERNSSQLWFTALLKYVVKLTCFQLIIFDH